MTTFITGGTTPLGRVLVKELVRQGEALRILVRPDSKRAGLELPGVAFVRGDITDPVAVRKGLTGCDRICHLAGISGRRHTDDEIWRVNRDGTKNVLQAALDMRVESVVLVSSLAALGPTQGEEPQEDRLIDPATVNTAYRRSRLTADDDALDFAEKGLGVKVVYPGFGFGPAVAYGHPGFAGETLLRMAAGQSVAIIGNGRNRICLTSYLDTAQGIERVHAHGRAGASYILGGSCLSLIKIWEVIAQVLGKEPPARHVPLWMAQLSSWFGNKSTYSAEYLQIVGQNWNYTSQKARRELGWQPQSLYDAMSDAWAESQAHSTGNERKRAEYAARRA
jgi:dihydroflavonol-4-reductase